MSAAEREIIEKFHLLEGIAKQRVLNTLIADLQATFNYDDWWAQVDALQMRMKKHLTESEMVGALSLLDELREEES